MSSKCQACGIDPAESWIVIETVLMMMIGDHGYNNNTQITCATCQICEEPPALDGIDVIIQAVPLTDTKVSIWYKATVPIAGAQYVSSCTGRTSDMNEATNSSLCLSFVQQSEMETCTHVCAQIATVNPNS